jgi:hypothetical protein
MTNQSLIQKYQPRGEIEPKTPDTADADRKAVEAPLLIDNLWRQIDRWVNEGVRRRCGRRWHHAISVPEMIANHRKSKSG